MASEGDANKARQQHRQALMAGGAHSIGVEEKKRRGKSDWVVVAHVAPDAKVDLPDSLTCSSSKGKVDVPLVVERSEPYAFE